MMPRAYQTSQAMIGSELERPHLWSRRSDVGRNELLFVSSDKTDLSPVFRILWNYLLIPHHESADSHHDYVF